LTKSGSPSKILTSKEEAALFLIAVIAFLHYPDFAMGSLAADLKTEREKRNTSLAQIAADTHISLHYLQCLEEGRYADLPGGMYNRAFLRAYCENLSLDQPEIMQRYEVEVAAPMDKLPKPRVHIPQTSSSLKPNPVLIWSLALLISAIGIFFSRNWIAAVFSPYFSRRTAAILPHELEQKPGPPPSALSASPEGIQAAEPSASPVNTLSESSPLIPATAQTEAAPPAIIAQTAASPDSAPPPLQSSLQLEVAATQQCWISIEQDGSRSFRKLMNPGDVQRLYAAEQFFIIVGNAGGVQLKINGKPAKSLGKPGEVVKILINGKNLHDYLDQSAG
jgi:cytoskeleton protein RodZ